MYRVSFCLNVCLYGALAASLARGAEPSRPNPSEPANVFQTLDTNHDEVIEEKEVPPGAPRQLKTFLKAADKDGDKRVTKEEFQAVMTARARKAAGRRPLPRGVKLVADLAYVEGGDAQNRLDLYLPEEVKSPLPVVVWIHGGGWQMGSKEGCPAVPMVLKGFAVASINYRLSSKAAFPAQIEDCKAAIRWLRSNAEKYHLDADHIGVWGESAGGHLAALLGTGGEVQAWNGSCGPAEQSSRVQAVCDWYGPADFNAAAEKYDVPAVKQLLGNPTADLKEKAAAASPVTYVSPSSAPFLIFHGDKDEIVPVEQSQLLADALTKAGVAASLEIVKGGGHGGPPFATLENQNLILDFFLKHLGGPPTP